MTVEIGCYCGAQPVNGIARKYVATAQGCEQAAATSCALGCANQSGQIAQDGTMVSAGTLVVAHCDRSSGSGVCKSSVTMQGSGDPAPSGW